MAFGNANSLPLGGSSSDAMARARVEYDRRNRSLPHRRYGPYTCPRCAGMFWSSPHFAGHMKSHYKYESQEEKKVRLEEKQRRRGNPRGPARAVAGPTVMAFQPVQLSQARLQTLNNAPMAFGPIQPTQVMMQTPANASMPVKTENVEAKEMKMEMEMEMEEVEGVGNAPPGFEKIKDESVE